MTFSEVSGHQRPLRVLQRVLASGRVPHAQLFWGPEGVGKELVARALARVLLCADPGARDRGEGCGRCGPCAKCDGGSHPDLHLVVAQKASISVDDVRRLQETLAYQAFERGCKVAIIRDAFRLTREAANALLKTLEEPPAGVYLVLLAHHRNQLLPTLVSRCQALRFDPLPEAEVLRLLTERGVEAATAAAMAAVSGGCPGPVLDADPEEFLAADREAGEVVAQWGRQPAGRGFALASGWAADKDRLGTRLDGLERHLRRRAREQAVSHPADADGGELDALAGLTTLRYLLERNVNAQLALDALFLGMLGHLWEEGP
ncbi:MAG: DNA polymerase III subunit delta' [Deferrisomatales bacterium]|nr:DNA polymerase III subunit delta' [Deferrisomatales bacterium]